MRSSENARVGQNQPIDVLTLTHDGKHEQFRSRHHHMGVQHVGGQQDLPGAGHRRCPLTATSSRPVVVPAKQRLAGDAIHRHLGDAVAGSKPAGSTLPGSPCRLNHFETRVGLTFTRSEGSS
jgi:hypothetical protein